LILFGFVKRDFTIRNVSVGMEAKPDGIGLVDGHEISQLTDVRLEPIP